MNPEPTAWQLGLEHLDNDNASYGSTAPHSLSLTLPRDQWEKMGRPSWIEVAPRPVQVQA